MEYLNRRTAALAELAAGGLDTLLVTKITHVRYLTGFTGTAGVLLLAPEPVLVVDFRYAMQAGQQTDGVKVVGDCAPPQLWPTVVRMLSERRPGRLGVDPKNLTAEQYLNLAAELGTEPLVDCAGLLERKRVVKDADEVAALQEAADLAEELMRRVAGWLRPGRKENEIAGEIEHAQRGLGAERSAAPILVSSGERSVLPHGQASGRVLCAGDPVVVDVSPVIRGYRADLTRTFFLGSAPAEYRRLQDAVVAAHGAAMSATRDGIRASDLDAVARQTLAQYGLAEYFKHSLGHSIGLDQHEPPLLSPYDDTVLRSRMVVMIEPGVYVPGVGGFRVEDAVLVTDDSCIQLSTSDPGLREL